MKILLFLLIMAGVGVFMMGLPLQYLSFRIWSVIFVTIFDIRFTQVRSQRWKMII